MRSEGSTKSTEVSSREIRDRLRGIVRTTDIDVDLDSHHYIVLSQLYTWMEREALAAAHVVLLDYGCGGQTYRKLFEPKVTSYIEADVATAANINLDIELLSNQPVPLSDSSVDTILANQTLEHVPDTDFYLKECYRLLRSDGTLILSAPMQWRHHEVPYDFFRFTKYGLTEVLNRNGFELSQIASTGGVYSLLGQIFLNHLAERGIQRRLLFRLVNSIALWLDRKIPDTEDTINWMRVAHKRASFSATRGMREGK
jgi:SAM-dependent methyltransferase